MKLVRGIEPVETEIRLPVRLVERDSVASAED